MRNWDARVELYNLNIPMRGDVEVQPVRYTHALPYYWARGYLYKEESAPVSGPVVNGTSHEHDGLCNGEAKAVNGTAGPSLKQRSFKWAAELSDMKKALQASEEGTDAYTVLSGSTRLAFLPLSPFSASSFIHFLCLVVGCVLTIQCDSPLGEFLAYSRSGWGGESGCMIKWMHGMTISRYPQRFVFYR